MNAACRLNNFSRVHIAYQIKLEIEYTLRAEFFHDGVAYEGLDMGFVKNGIF